MFMHFQIRHRTAYAFSEPVFVEPHIIRLRPRADGFQLLAAYSLDIDPEPAGLTFGIDLYGNTFASAWFNGLTPHLVIETRATIETTRSNPFDYLLAPEGVVPLPWEHPDPRWAAYLGRPTGAEEDDVARFARELAATAPLITDFLAALNNRLYNSMDVIIREEGDPFEPEQTLSTAVGSCRDIAVVFMDACRAMGVPSRFVSGYQEGDPEQPRRDLHAWAEAWVPGAGWCGYDPTLGLIVADGHIAVAAAPEPRDAAPLTGSFRGSPATTSMTYEIELEAAALGSPTEPDA